jgi:hypothetical protein
MEEQLRDLMDLSDLFLSMWRRGHHFRQVISCRMFFHMTSIFPGLA